MASSLSISRAWDETRDIFQRDGKLLIAVALALIVLPEVVAGLIAPPETSATAAASGSVQLLRLAVGLISLVGQLALIRLALGPSTTVGAAIGHGARRFPAVFGAILVLVLALAVPLSIILVALGVDPQHLTQLSPAASSVILIFGLAALALSVKFTMVSPVGSAETVGPIAVLKRSWHLTSGHYLRLLGFIGLLLIATLVLMIVAGVVGGLLARLVSPTIEPMSLGALLLSLCAGAAQGVFSILASVMLARVYAQLAGAAPAAAEAR